MIGRPASIAEGSGGGAHDQPRRKHSFFAGFKPPTGFDQPEQGLDRVIGNSFVVMCRGGQRRAGESGIGVVVMGREAIAHPSSRPTRIPSS